MNKDPLGGRKLQIHSKSKFSPEEDAHLIELVKIYGDSEWSKISFMMPGRNTRQCRERWRHYLAPEVSMAPFTAEEDALLNAKYLEMGPKWKQMATYFKGRTDIAIKNRWLLLNRREQRKKVTEQIKEQTKQEPEVQVDKDPKPGEIDWNEETSNYRDDGDVAFSTDLTTDYFCLNFTF